MARDSVPLANGRGAPSTHSEEGTMKRIAMGRAWMISAFALVSAASAPALARSVPGTYGVSRDGAACLMDIQGSLQISPASGCASASIVYPLVMDAAGWFTVTIHGWAPDPDHNLDCTLFTMSNGDRGDVFWWPTTSVSLSTFGRGDTILLTQWAPANGASFVQCDLRAGARINVVEW
jgi:hypothetical protein